ncbi:MAG: hypothetical protein AAB413_01745 [Patescibacteria group bacterium]
MEKSTTIPRGDDASTGVQIQESETEVAVIITNLHLHTTVLRKPKTFAEGVRRSLTSGKAGRVHQSDGFEIAPDGQTFKFTIPIEGMDRVVADAAAKGQRVRFYIPRDGLPLYIGKDLIQRTEALKRQDKV